MVFDLGFIKAIHSGPTPPVNTQMLWYDTGALLHKYYDTGGASWVPLASGAASWSIVLASGSATLGQSPIISPGDSMLFENGGFQLSLGVGVLTAPQTAQFQNASGVVAYLSDIAGAGNWNASLTAGAATGGVSPILTSGDQIISSVGTAYLNLRNGANSKALLHGLAEAKLSSGTLVALTSGTLITMVSGSGPTIAVTTTGLGVNQGSPTSLFHITVAAGAPNPAGTSVIRIENGVNSTHIGIATAYTYMQSHVGWLALNPIVNGKSVGVRTGALDPAAGGNDILFAIGEPNVLIGGNRSMAIYTESSGTAKYKTFKGLTYDPVMTFGHDSSGNGLIENEALNKFIAVSVNKGGVQVSPVRISGITGSTDLSEGLAIKVENNVAAHAGGINLLATHTDGRILIITNFPPVTLTGIEGGYDGRVLVITNKHAGTLTFQHASGSVGNEILCPNNINLPIKTGESATFWYDRTPSAWRVIARTQ